MKNVLLILALVAAAIVVAAPAQAGGMVGTHAHNGFHHNGFYNGFYNGFGYGGYGGYNSFAFAYPYGVVSPYAASYVPVASVPVASAGYGGCSAASGYGSNVELVTVAPAYPAFYPTAAYNGFNGYNNSFFFSRFIRGRTQAFRHH